MLFSVNTSLRLKHIHTYFTPFSIEVGSFPCYDRDTHLQYASMLKYTLVGEGHLLTLDLTLVL